MTILEGKNILTAVMDPWIERSQHKLLSGQAWSDEIFLFLSPYVLFLLVLTMKTNEAVGYQGCPIHLVLLYFLLPGPDWVATGRSPVITTCTHRVSGKYLQFTHPISHFQRTILPANPP